MEGSLRLLRSCCLFALCCVVGVVVQYSSYCVCRAQCVCCSLSLFFAGGLFWTFQQGQSCSCSCCFVLLFKNEREQEKTREEEFRKDRTNGEEVMLLRFDQYKCTWGFDSWLHGSNGALCTYISTYQNTFKPCSDMNGISFVTVALETSSCHKWDKIVP